MSPAEIQRLMGAAGPIGRAAKKARATADALGTTLEERLNAFARALDLVGEHDRAAVLRALAVDAWLLEEQVAGR